MIAEAGVNHNGDPAMAVALIDAAAAAGADAVKFQTFRADRLVTQTAAKAPYQRQATDPDESQFEMLRRLELTPATHRALRDHCHARGITFLSTPFDEDSADLLEQLDVAAFKIGSGELTNIPLLKHVARKRRPVVLSTGMSGLEDVRQAVDAVRGEGAELVLLHCVSNYPADPADANLRAMATLRETFHVPVGFSDHTEGDEVALASVALGAVVVEKHLTLDRTLPGPDHRASIEPDAFGTLVARIRRVEAALGTGAKTAAASEAAVAAVARRSLVAASAIAAGAVIESAMIEARRPGTGLPPAYLDRVVGRVAAVDIPPGTVISLEMLR